MSMVKFVRRALWLAGLLIATLMQSAYGAPVVKSYSLVASTRSGRTTFDYTYRLLLVGDTKSYRNVVYTVTSNSSSTQVTSGTVNVGDLDPEQVLLTTATFTIRQDRTAPFNPQSLSFKFAGQQVGIASGTTSNLRIGPLTFLEGGGRPEHEGTFPLQGSAPPAGAQLGMIVDIYGALQSASYQLVDVGGAPLANGMLTVDSTAGPDWSLGAALVSIPATPFRIAVTAVGTDGAQLSWQSSLYSPSAVALRIDPTTAVLSKGQIIPVVIHVAGGIVGGDYTIRLWLPPGFAGDAGPWAISAQAGQITDISTSLTAPTTGAPFAHYILVAEGTSADPTMPFVVSTLEFEVE